MEYLNEYGLLGAFDTVCLMMGERNAILDPLTDYFQLEQDDDQSEDDDGITFSDLQFSSQAIATMLYHRFGVRIDDNVLYICDLHAANTGAEISSMIGAMRIGCPFIPVDMLDRDRIRHVVHDVEPLAAIIVASRTDGNEFIAFLNSLGVYRCLLLEATGSLAVDEANQADIREDLPELNHLESSCLYILYTSGSTGEPKGVRGTHGGLMSRLVFQHGRFPLNAGGEVFLRRTPLTFVDSMAEIWFALLNAAPLYAPPPKALREEGVAALAKSFERIGITRITILPSILAQAIRLSPTIGTDWPTLSICHVSGEPCPVSLVQEFHKRFPAATLVNFYGSTEVAGDVSFAVLAASESAMISLPHLEHRVAPIGNVIGENVLLVIAVDTDTSSGREMVSSWKTCPDGVSGELFVRGPHVADGYHNNRAETARRFLPGVSIDGLDIQEPIFRTGDIAVRENGCLYWLGRVDNQVKIRGIRVELEAIECKVLEILGISEGIAVIATDQLQAQNQLVLFIEESILTKSLTNARSILQFLIASSMPAHMIPAFVLPIDKLPRSSAGKLDRTALRSSLSQIHATVSPELPVSVLDADSTSDQNRSEVQSKLASALSIILLIPQPQIDFSASFLSLGGDSMTSVELLWRIRQIFHLPLAAFPPSLLQQPLATLVAHISLSMDSEGQCTSEANGNPVQVRSAVKRKCSSVDCSVDKAPSAAPRDRNNPTVAIVGWSGRGTSRYMPQSMSHSPPDYHPPNLKTKWVFRLSRCVDASPLISYEECSSRMVRTETPDLFVYVGDHAGMFVKINDTGCVVWLVQLTVRQDLGEVEQLHIEGQAASTTSQGLVLVSSYRGQDTHSNHSNTNSIADDDKTWNGHTIKQMVHKVNIGEHSGVIWALVPATGEAAWSISVQGEAKGAPVVDEINGRVLVPTYRGVSIHELQDGSSLAVIEASWTFFASPVLTASRIYSASTNGLISCIKRDTLAPMWTYAHTTDDDASIPIFSTPLVLTENETSDHALLLCAVDGALTCLKLDDSQPPRREWTHPTTRPIFSSPTIVGQSAVAFGSHDGWLRCVEPSASGSLIWETDCSSVLFSAPTVIETQESSLLCIANTGGEVLLVDAQCGTLSSRLRLPGEIYSSPTCSLDGTKIFIGCRDDCIRCLSW